MSTKVRRLTGTACLKASNQHLQRFRQANDSDILNIVAKLIKMNSFKPIHLSGLKGDGMELISIHQPRIRELHVKGSMLQVCGESGIQCSDIGPSP